MKSSPWLLGVLVVIGISLNASSGLAEEFRYDQIAALTDVLPPRTDYYIIDERVTVEGALYVFTVSSPHSPSRQIYGIADLLKECHELTVMEWYYSTPQGSEVLAGLKESVGNTVQGAKQIVTHPGDSAQAMKRSAGRTWRSVKGAVKSIGKDDGDSEGEDLAAGAGNLFTADQARKVAYELHLDSYTRNPNVRHLLNTIALKRSAGGAGVSVATSVVFPMSLIVSATSSFMLSGALTPGAYLESTEVTLRDNPPTELYRELHKSFAVSATGGNSRAQLFFETFTANPNYSPRDKAYITAFLTQLGNLPGLEGAVQTLAAATTVEVAETLYHQLEFLSSLSLNNRKFELQSYVGDKGNIFGITTANDVVAILPFDYLRDDGEFTEDLQHLQSINAATRSVWLLGTCDESFKKALSAHGVNALYVNILQFSKEN